MLEDFLPTVLMEEFLGAEQVVEQGVGVEIWLAIFSGGIFFRLYF